MPVIKSAIKKARHDKKREKANDAMRRQVESAIRLAKRHKAPKNISHAFSLIDRAVKKNLMHKNHAARIKSALAKLARLERSRGTKPTGTTRKKKAGPSKK